MALIVPEMPGAEPAVEILLDQAFGPTRYTKTAQRLRDGNTPAPGLSFLALDETAIVGTLRFWGVRLGDAAGALLLGPIAIDRSVHGRGLGQQMIRHGLRRARQLGHAAVILIGDAPYYERFGFSAELTRGLTLPGPVDRHRFLGLELVASALAGATGLVAADVARRTRDPLRRAA